MEGEKGKEKGEEEVKEEKEGSSKKKEAREEEGKEEKEKISKGGETAEEGISPQRLLKEIEELKLQISMLKDLQKSSEEKLATSLERIGELRSSLLEKDRMIREALVSFKRIGEIVYELEPQKLVEERKRFES